MSAVGVQLLPMITLSRMMTAFVVLEPESKPAVSPTCLSRASSSFLSTMVTNASILVRSCPDLVLSVKEYVTTGMRVLFWMNFLSSVRTSAASAQRKQEEMNTASAS